MSKRNLAPLRDGSQSVVQSVARAAAILRALSQDGSEFGLNELSRRVGLGKSTVHRLLRTLVDVGLVEQNLETSMYRVGVGILRLAQNVFKRMNDLQSAARPHLHALASATQETINLSVLSGDGAINIERIPSSFEVSNVGWVGRWRPLHCVSAGKVFLAHLHQPEKERILMQKHVRYTENTITDPARLREELEQVSRLGYSVVRGELETGLNAVAAPIRDHRGMVTAAVTVSGPYFRITPETMPQLATLVVQTADAISREMGYYQKTE